MCTTTIMKQLVIVLALTTLAHAGLTPASTTLIKQATTITHPGQTITTYSQPALPYSHVPVAYGSILPQFLPSAPHHQYSLPLFAQQQIFAQFPNLIAQNPVVQQYPVFGGQLLGGSPAVEPAIPEQPEPLPQPQAPQSPILSGPVPGSTLDDDTVSIEAANRK